MSLMLSLLMVCGAPLAAVGSMSLHEMRVSKGFSWPPTEGELNLEDVSLLGLQRSVTFHKRPTAKALLHGAAKAKQNVSWPLAEEVEAAALPHTGDLNLEDVSLLGLQRTVKILRRQPLKETPHGTAEAKQDISWPLVEEAETAALPHMGDLNLEDVSLLGLQRTVKITRRQRLKETPHGNAEAKQDVSWPLAEEAEVPTPLHLDDLNLEDVSLLGLQRSVKIIRRQPLKESPHGAAEAKQDVSWPLAEEDEAAMPAGLNLADVSLLGLQRTMKITRRQPLKESLHGAVGAKQDVSWPLAEEDEVAMPAGLNLADVSLLGLQRTVKITRRQPLQESLHGAVGAKQYISGPLAEEDEEAMPLHPGELNLADVSLLGLQRSVKITRRQPLKESSDVFSESRPTITGESMLGLRHSAFMSKTTM